MKSKRLLAFWSIVLFAFMVIAACGKVDGPVDPDNTDPEKPEVPVPDVDLKIELVEATDCEIKVSFVVKEYNVLYTMVREKSSLGEELPDGEAIINEGTLVPDDLTYEFKNLQPETEYVVLAAMGIGKELFTDSIEITTDSPRDYKVSLTTPADCSYEGKLFTSACYYFALTNCEMDGIYTVSGGVVLELDTYGPVSDNPDHAQLASGTYVCDTDSENPTWNEYSISINGYSALAYINDDGTENEARRAYVTGGSMTVENNDGQYVINGKFSLSDGRNIEFDYEGPLVFRNDSGGLGEDYNCENLEVKAAYYRGNTENRNLGEYIIELGNYSDSKKIVTEPGAYINLDFYASTLAADPQNARLPQGRYTYFEDYFEDISGNQISARASYAKLLEVGDVVDGASSGQGIVWTDGWVDVSYSGDNCVMDGRLTMNGGKTFYFKFNGPIDWLNLEMTPVGPVTDLVFNQADGVWSSVNDTDEKFDLTFRAENGLKTTISLFDLKNQSDASDVTINDGTYTISEAGYGEAAPAGTFVKGGKYYDYWYYGSWCFRKNNFTGSLTETPVISGTVTSKMTKENGSEIYDITLDLTTEEGVFTASYKGEIPFFSSTPHDPVGDLNVTLTDVYRYNNYGTVETGATELYVELIDCPFTSDTGVPRDPPGNLAVLVFYCDGTGSGSTIRIPSGEYPLSDLSTGKDSKEPFTCGVKNTFIRTFDKFGEWIDIHPYQAGKVTVKDNGNSYDIKMDLLTWRDEKIVATYKGDISFEKETESSSHLSTSVRCPQLRMLIDRPAEDDGGTVAFDGGRYLYGSNPTPVVGMQDRRYYPHKQSR